MAVTTQNFSLTPAQAAPIVEETRNRSIVMQLGTQVPMSEGGTKFPVFGSRPTARIVGEQESKPLWDPSLSSASMQKSKFAMLTVLSSEVVRADLAGSLAVGSEDSSSGVGGVGGVVARVKRQIGESFSVALDQLALHGGVAGQHYIDEATSTVTLGTAAASDGGVFADLNSVLEIQSNKDKPRKTTGFLFDSSAEHILNGSTDTTGRPLFIETPLTENAAAFRPGRVLGRQSYITDELVAPGSDSPVVGYAGNWSHVFYGILTQPTFRMSTDGSYTGPDGQLRSALEHNEVIIVAEFEAGVYVHDPEDFVKLAKQGSGEAA